MLSRMSVRASRARLESIKRVALHTRSDERLQAAAIGDVDADREQIREVLRDPDIFEKADGGLGGQARSKYRYRSSACSRSARASRTTPRDEPRAGAVPLGGRATWQ